MDSLDWIEVVNFQTYSEEAISLNRINESSEK